MCRKTWSLFSCFLKKIDIFSVGIRFNIEKEKARVIYMTPQGKPFNQKIAQELSKEEVQYYAVITFDKSYC